MPTPADKQPFTVEQMLDGVRRYVGENLPGRRPLRLVVHLDDGEEIRLPVPFAAAASQTECSSDGRSLRWFGRSYAFSAAQGAVVRALYDAWQAGSPEVAGQRLLELAESDGGRVRDLFWKTSGWPAFEDGVIGPGRTKGTLRLFASDEIV